MKKITLAILLSALAFAAIAAQITVTTTAQKIEPPAEIPGTPYFYSIVNTGLETIYFRANFPTNRITTENSISLEPGASYSAPIPGEGSIPAAGFAYIAIMTTNGTSTANVAFDAFK